MFKSIYGPITNPKTGKSKDIVINPFNSNGVRDILIGSGIILIGISYVALSAFKNGANAFEQAEYDVMESLGLFTD